MPTFDVSTLNTAFAGSSEIFQKQVLGWDIRSVGVQVRTNVKTPHNLAKFSADGKPRPYRAADDFNGATVTDRLLTAYPSKYDQQLDFVELYNTYLAEMPEMPFEDYAVQQAMKQYVDALNSDTLWLGVRDANGSDCSDICDGWGTIIAAEITATNITPVAGAAITSSNAVTQVELVADAASVLMKKKGFRILCSYGTLEKYRKHYRSTYGFTFDPNKEGEYKLDGVKAILTPCDFMGTSQRLVATFDNNLVFGTDADSLKSYPTPHLNLFQNRIMMNAGCQIKDIGAEVLVVNDQA
jgi:hypothetical protein